MKINKQEMLSIIDKVKPGLAKKEVIEQASHLVFSDNEIVTFNDSISVSHPFECDVEFSVRGDDFYKIVNGIAEPEFEITLTDSTLNIKSKTTKAALSTILGEAAQVTHLIEAVRECTTAKGFWKKLPEEFLKGLHLCSFSASTDLTTGVKSCCAVNGDSIYTTDNIRASIYVMDKSMDSLMLPAKSVSDLIKYPVEEYGVSDNWAHFRTKAGVVFNAKMMKGDYPFKGIDKLFTEAPETLAFPEELGTVVSSIAALAEGDGDIDKAITITVEAGKITCKAQKERGWITKTVACEYKGDTFVFMVNPLFFSQVLKQATAFTLIGNKGMFNSDSFNHILSLPMED